MEQTRRVDLYLGGVNYVQVFAFSCTLWFKGLLHRRNNDFGCVVFVTPLAPTPGPCPLPPGGQSYRLYIWVGLRQGGGDHCSHRPRSSEVRPRSRSPDTWERLDHLVLDPGEVVNRPRDRLSAVCGYRLSPHLLNTLLVYVFKVF